MTGWICPRCGSVYSLLVSKCGVCGPMIVTGATTNSIMQYEDDDVPDVCDCGVPFPDSGYCKFCGAHARYIE